MSCKSGGTSYRFPGKFSSEGWYLWVGELKKSDFRFWIASDDWRVYLCFRYLYIADILWNYIQASLGSLCLSNYNYTLMVGKVIFLLYMVSFIVGFLGGSVMKVDIAGVVEKKRATSGFGSKVMLGGSIYFSGTWKLQLYCGTIFKLS